MTQETAKRVFDILLFELRAKRLTDVGTLLIDSSKEGEYGRISEEDKYQDTDAELLELEMQSRLPQGAVYALRRLLDATIEYFQLSSSMPRKFQSKLEDIGFTGYNLTIKTETLFGEEENYDSILESPNVDKLLEMLELIQSSIELNDEDFMKVVNTI